MKITIITVCYNSEKTIEKSIQSVLSQSYPNIEFVIIDGGSCDNTLDIIKKYQNKIYKFISEPDQGLYDAMNKGISLSSGELIGILNSDDVFFDNNVIEKVVNFHKTFELDASISDIIQTDAYGKRLRLYTAKYWNPSKLRSGIMPPHPSIFFKRYLFEKFGNYAIDLKIAADYEIVIRFFLLYNISWKYLNIITTKMLIGGISSNGIRSYLQISKEIFESFARNNIEVNKLLVHLRWCKKIYELKILKIIYNMFLRH